MINVPLNLSQAAPQVPGQRPSMEQAVQRINALQWSNSKSCCLVHIIFTCLHSAASMGFLLGQFCATHSNVGACWLVFNESRHLVDGSVWTKRHCLLKARKNSHLSLCSSHRFTLSCGSWTDLLQKFASVMIPI